MQIAELITIGLALLGLSGVIFTALSFRRNDTTAIVSQQDAIFNEMKTINDELRLQRDEARAELSRLQTRPA